MASANRSRKRKFNVYLLDEEWEILEAKKDEAEMTKSDFIRNVIMFGAAHKRTMFSKEDSQRLIYELNRIGNNINQIAAKVNSKGTVDEIDFENLQELYISLLGAYDDFIRGKSNGDY